MKRFVVSIVTLLILFNTAAFATSDTYKLDELGLKVTIPSEYSVITGDTSANDPIFKELGTTKTALLNQFKSNNIYLNAISNEYNEEIVVTMEENMIDNFSLLSETMLELIATSLVGQFADIGAEVTDYEIYQHPQAKFIRLYYKRQSEGVDSIQFYTVYDGKAINFTLNSYDYDGTYSNYYRRANTIKSVVDSIIFDNEPLTSKPYKKTDSFVYTDTDSGVSFTVPTNWKQDTFTKERENLDVKFASTKDPACLIMFGSTDMWSQIPDSEKKGYSRSDINNSFFTKSDVAEIYDLAEDDVSVVTYNGVQYYKYEDVTSSEEEINISIKATQLIHINNGWMHFFCFGGTSKHSLYSDFETLLNSVNYTSAETSSDTDYSGIIVLIFIALLLISGIIVTVIVIKSRKPKFQISGLDIDKSKTCRNCGQALPSDSEFCHICGTKTE